MKTAFIFAAGRGERLKPLTDHKPKALCTIHGIPLIEYHVQNLARAGFERLIINHAYLGGQIKQHFSHGAPFGLEILYAPEPPGGLETGGGIVNVLSLLGSEPFATINADIVTDFPFDTLCLPASGLTHLVLIKTPSYLLQADFGLNTARYVENTHRQYTFSGIACHHPRRFQSLHPGRYSLTPLLRFWANHHEVSGEVYEGEWCDVGTPDRLEELNIRTSSLRY